MLWLPASLPQERAQAVQQMPVRLMAHCVFCSAHQHAVVSTDRYCSRECQRSSWSVHKLMCKSMAEVGVQLRQPENRKLKQQSRAFMTWLGIWQCEVNHFGVVGMDLRNNPGILGTHA